MLQCNTQAPWWCSTVDLQSGNNQEPNNTWQSRSKLSRLMCSTRSFAYCSTRESKLCSIPVPWSCSMWGPQYDS
jgi:hypothetical protein